MSDEKEKVKGMVVRGADGVLYFVPEEKLKAFAIPEANVPRLDGVAKKSGKHILKDGPHHITISADEAAVADVHMLPEEKQSETGA